MFGTKTGVVGISVHDDDVRVLQFTQTHKGLIVHAAGRARLPRGIVDSGAVQDGERLSKAIKDACDHAVPNPIKAGARAACALPESKTFVRIMMMPQMPEEQVASAVQWEIEEYIPLPLTDVYYDFQRVPQLEKEKEQMAIVVVAAAHEVVDQYMTAIEGAGLVPVCIEADSIADARAVLAQDEMQGGNMVLFCGQNTSRLAIITEGVPIFAVSVPVGIASFEADVSRAFGVSTKEAKRMIAEDGIGSYITKDPLFEAIMPSLRSLSDEVRKSADFCLKALAQCEEVSSVALCGEGALIKGLRSYLVKETGLPIAIADPWRGVDMPEQALPPLSRTESLDAVTVIGLASRDIVYEDFN